MFFKKVKIYIKKNYPILTRRLIAFRDSNYFFKFLKDFFFINLDKKVHGKQIVKKERGFIIDLSKDNYVSYTIRPKKTSGLTFEKELYYFDDTAIIIQGSLKGVSKFTSETIKLYCKIFKNSKIILSTWEDEIDKNFYEYFKDKVEIILNKKPKNILYNTDLQIISTNKALKIARLNNCKYVLKTRTDCRVYNKNSINHLKNLLKLFPINKKYENLNSRIISCSVDTRKYRVYGLSDIFLFSEINNLEIYFNEENYINSLERYFGKYPCIINETAVINEIFLCARFLKKINIDLNWELKHWWQICGEIFCIVDPSDLDFFWYKYEWKYEQRFIQDYTSNFKQALKFSDWLNLYFNNAHQFDDSSREKWNLKDGIIEQ